MPRFSYYFFSVLCKLVKELYPYRLTRFGAKADAKVRTFWNITKSLSNFFQYATKIFRFVDKMDKYTLFIIGRQEREWKGQKEEGQGTRGG